MGFYNSHPAYMKQFRFKIETCKVQAEKLVHNFAKQNVFRLEGEKYKRQIGKDLPPLLQDWYQRKNLNFFTQKKLEEIIFSPQLPEKIFQDFQILKPIFQFCSTNAAE